MAAPDTLASVAAHPIVADPAPTAPTRPDRERLAARRRSRFYRLLRDLHAWLSALAFLLLMFFSFTGLTLNHPEWFEERATELPSQHFTLPAPVLAQVQQDLSQQHSAANPVLDFLHGQAQTYGQFKSSEQLDDEMLIRLEGVQGNTDLTVNLRSGEVEVLTTPARLIDTVNDLHRGKNTGTSWRWLIDATAILILLLSLAGYVLFFGLKKRLATTLTLTTASLSVIGLMLWSSLG